MAEHLNEKLAAIEARLAALEGKPADANEATEAGKQEPAPEPAETPAPDEGPALASSLITPQGETRQLEGEG